MVAGVGGTAERRGLGGVGAEQDRRRQRKRVGKGFPLQSSDKHRLDAEVAMGTGRKGIEPKAVTRMRRGAAGCVAWNLATFSGALATFPESSQVLASRL